MKTLYDQITEWKTTGVWDSICKLVTVSDTWERYYKIVSFVDQHGDRMQKLVFIGQHLDKKAITSALDNCLQ